MIEMGRRLAGEGYTVLVVNPYYRDRTGQIWEDFAAFADGGWDMARAMREKLSSDAVMRDAKAIVTWLDTQDEVDTARGIGTRGFCMGGPFTVYTAHAVPPRIKAAASFHGGGLVREDDQSPHKLLAETQASYLFAIAQDDDAKAPQDKTVLRQSADAAGRPAMVDVYAGDHGWTVPDSPAYDRAAAERAYADGFALFSRAL
jgi:carboxymethylenebutenolidase